jgi:predicted dehydrogenase
LQNFVGEYLENKQEDLPKVFGGPAAYDELILSDVSDALYVPLPVAIKKDWVIKALKAGKHVVLEKPAALTAADYQEMLNVAYVNNKFLMDGTMFPHHPRTSKILDSLSEIGQVNRIQASFSFLAHQAFLDGTNIRARKDGDPHGCIGDLGWYCIRYALVVFGKLGSKVESAQVVDFEVNKHGVPIDATCVVKFQNVSTCTGSGIIKYSCTFPYRMN